MCLSFCISNWGVTIGTLCNKLFSFLCLLFPYIILFRFLIKKVPAVSTLGKSSSVWSKRTLCISYFILSSCLEERGQLISFHSLLPVCVLSCVRLFAISWTVAPQVPLSMEFSRQEYWIGLPFPTPGDLSDPGIKSAPLMSPALAGGFFSTAPPGKPFLKTILISSCAL